MSKDARDDYTGCMPLTSEARLSKREMESLDPELGSFLILWLRLLAMHLRAGAGGNDLAHHAFQLGLHRLGEDVVFAVHKRLETLLGNFSGIIVEFSFGSDLGVVHARAMEKVRRGRAGLKNRDGDSTIFQFAAQRLPQRQHVSS